VQSLTHIPQALQSSVSTTGRGQAPRFTCAQGLPSPSSSAAFGQTRPQTPQSTQRFSFTEWRRPFSPEMANTGQARAHTLQPIQSSVM
jgi:hypothetical protein